MRFLAAVVLLLGLVACQPAQVSERQTVEMIAGISAVVNLDGQLYDLQIADVEGEIATVNLQWQDQLISSRRLYRGLYPMSADDATSRWVNEFDFEAVDDIFPLEVGNETSFSTKLRILNPEVIGKNYVVMTVTGQETMTIQDQDYDVYVIDIVTESRIQGRRFTYTRTVHYAPSLGMILKMVMVENNVTSYWRVMSLELPRGRPARERRNRLGTVAI